MSAANRVFLIALLVAAVYTGGVLLQRRIPPAPQVPNPHYADPMGLNQISTVTILSFYGSPGLLTEGESAILCYGVAKAKSVRIQPPVEALSPSLNRCFSVRPTEDTLFTLTAEGDDGRTVSESFTLQVKPDPFTLPRIVYFGVQKKADDRGQAVYSLCFQVENAERVRVEPPVIPEMRGAPKGCFYVAPRETTTYTLVAHGRRSEARRQVTTSIP